MPEECWRKNSQSLWIRLTRLLVGEGGKFISPIHGVIKTPTLEKDSLLRRDDAEACQKEYCKFCKKPRHSWVPTTIAELSTVAKSEICWFARFLAEVSVDFASTAFHGNAILQVTCQGSGEETDDFCTLSISLPRDEPNAWKLPCPSYDTDSRGIMVEIYDPNHVIRKPPDPSKNPVPFPGPPSTLVGSSIQQRLDQVAVWIQECTSNHADCYRGEHVLPTRILDLSQMKHNIIKLKDGANAVGHYAALSHCWGLSSPPKTTSATLSSMKAGILFHNLPRSFQDAVRVCLKLELKFLWIDSLCIVQDDLSEWNKEALKMGGIYENSYVTLVASSAPGSEAGFLQSREQDSVHPYSISIPSDGTLVPHDTTGVFLCRRRRFYHLDTDPIHERAWCFQEWALPKRLISFGLQELHYFCRVHDMCECNRRETAPNSVLWRQTFHSTTEETNSSDAYLLWRRIVNQYRSRNITKPTDRLPALAGLASKFGERLTDDYIAGLWSNNIIAGLCWDNFAPLEQPKPIKGVPSWSWAATTSDGAFYPWPSEFTIDATACNARWAPGQDQTSELPHSFLRIHGQAQLAHIHSDAKDEEKPCVSFLLKSEQARDMDLWLNFRPDCYFQPSPLPSITSSAGSETISQLYATGMQYCDRCPGPNDMSTQPEKAGLVSATRADKKGDHVIATVLCVRLMTDTFKENMTQPSTMILVLGFAGEMLLEKPNFIFDTRTTDSTLEQFPKRVAVYERLGLLIVHGPKVKEIWKDTTEEIVHAI